MPNEMEVGLAVDDRIKCLEKEVFRLQESLRFLVRYDLLTGCWNRAGILDILRQEAARLQRRQSDFAVIVFGADEFNSLNNQYGPYAGDAVLRAIARRVRPSVRPYDSLGRSGDNEFLIVAPGCRLGDALSMAERIRTLFAEECTDISQECTVDDSSEPPEERMIPVTLSLGVFASDELEDPGYLLTIAGGAFHLAKRKGGNRVITGDTLAMTYGSGPSRRPA